MFKIIKEILSYVIIIIVVILIRTYIATPVRVNGTSMVPSLEEKEILILNKMNKSFSREDIVVVSKKVEGSSIIKRIIGLPNEKIKCINGVIFINDEKYEDKYGFGTTTDFDEITLKDDEYFVLGDNRVVSKDSRMLGPIKEKYIEGTTNIILYPFNKIGKIKEHLK